MAKVELSDELIKGLKPIKGQLEFYDLSPYGSGSFGVRLNPAGRKTFFLIYLINGKRKRLTIGEYPRLSLADARSEAGKVIEQVRSGRDPASEKKSYTLSQSFAELSQLFLDEYADKHCSEKTCTEYRRILKAELLPAWSDIKAVDIKKTQLLALVDKIAKERKSPVMAKRVKALASNVFNFAVEKGICPTNPAQGTRLRLETYPKDRILTKDELRALWSALREENLITQGLFKTLLLSAQRPSDVISMRWKDISFDTWQISDSFSIYLSKYSENILKKIREENLSKEFIFPSHKENAHIRNIRKAALRLGKRMKCKQPWSPFDLRRSAEYYMREIGIPLEVVERIFNRKTLLGKLPKEGAGKRDYEKEVKEALNTWGKELMGIVAPGEGGDLGRKDKGKTKGRDGKVVSLF